MSDNLKIKQPQDPKKVNIHQEHERRYWSNKWKITEKQLRTAVEAVGIYVEDIERYLRSQGLL